MSNPIIPVFIDFDGVMHPWAPYSPGQEKDLFQYLPRIEDVLRSVQETRLIICSDWRKYQPWEDLLEVFAEDMRPRVIGATPVFSPNDFYTGLRFAESQAWLKERGLDQERWIAIDDVDDNWIDDVRVVVCNNGFFDEEEARLTEALLRLTQAPTAAPNGD